MDYYLTRSLSLSHYFPSYSGVSLVSDVSNPCWRKQEGSVTSVLNEIGAGDTPIIRVFNKIDLLDPEDAEILKYEAATCPDGEFSVGISSLTGEGLGDFVAVVEDALSGLLVPIEILLPYSCGHEVNRMHEVGSLEVVDYRETGTYVLGKVPRSLAMKLEQYSIHKKGRVETKTTRGKQVSPEDDIDWVALGKGRHDKKIVG
jgi:GTP-binding protein HflX